MTRIDGFLVMEYNKKDAKLYQNKRIMKVGHHGSSGSSTKEFLETVGPEWGIISCGAGNPYGHPSKETLQRLSDAGCRWAATSDQGALILRFSSSGYGIYSYKNND